MLKIIKIILVSCVLFLFKCYSLMPEFNRIITENAVDKCRLFEKLKTITTEENKILANEYIALYGDNTLTGEARKNNLAAIDPF